MDLGLRDRTALVTGGSHGLGRSVALALAREGVRVAICGRHQDTLAASAELIVAETGATVVPVVADVRDEAELHALAVTAEGELRHLDILVNNADLATRTAEFADLRPDDWAEKFRVKVVAAATLIQLLTPGMCSRRWGRIINVSGGTSRRLIPGSMPKGAAHAALINMTRQLADVLGSHGITVNAIEPGEMWTDGRTVGGRTRAEIRREMLEGEAARAGISYEQADERRQARLVIGRPVSPDDAAGIITFLASERAATITGEVIVADGGESKYVRY